MKFLVLQQMPGKKNPLAIMKESLEQLSKPFLEEPMEVFLEKKLESPEGSLKTITIPPISA